MTSPFISSSHRKITVMCLISSLLEFFCLCILKRDGVSLMAHMVRTPPEMQEPWVQYIYWHTYIFLDSIYLHVLKEFTVSGFQWGNPAIFLFLVVLVLLPMLYVLHQVFIGVFPLFQCSRRICVKLRLLENLVERTFKIMNFCVMLWNFKRFFRSYKASLLSIFIHFIFLIW